MSNGIGSTENKLAEKLSHIAGGSWFVTKSQLSPISALESGLLGRLE